MAEPLCRCIFGPRGHNHSLKHGFGLNKILGTIHIYPTLAEANKYVAGVWKKQNAPETALKFLSDSTIGEDSLI
jgi:hypothetical protein